MIKVNNCDLLSVKSFSVLVHILYLNVILDGQDPRAASFHEEKLALVRIRRVCLVIHLDPIGCIIVSTQNYKENRLEHRLPFVESEAERNEWITRGARVSWQAHLESNTADILGDPLLQHLGP